MHSSPDDYYNFIPGIHVYQMPRKGQAEALHSREISVPIIFVYACGLK